MSGCDLCGDFPVHLAARCHPTAPLRMEMADETTLRAYCYIPTCNRFVAEFRIEQTENPPLSVGTPENPHNIEKCKHGESIFKGCRACYDVAGEGNRIFSIGAG